LNEEKFGRNDKIIVTKDGVEKEIKHKKLGDAISDGWILKK
jgi:hypothetical protein